jgi:hypothetical protein
MHLPFQTTVEQWWETHGIRTDNMLWRKDKRFYRHLLQEIDKEHQAVKKLSENMFNTPKVVHEHVTQAYENFTFIMQKEFAEVTGIIMDHKLLLNRQLDKLVEVEENIRLFEPNHPSLKEIHQIYVALEKEIEGQLASFTSFFNTTWTLMQVLSDSAKAREMYAALLHERKDMRDVTRELDALESEARNKKPINEAEIAKLKKDIEADINDRKEIFNDALLLLQKILATVSTGRESSFKAEQQRPGDIAQLIEKVRKERNYPPDWAEEHYKYLIALEKPVFVWLDKEINKGRLFISKAEHVSG